MVLISILPFIAAAFSLGLAVFVLLQDLKSLVHRLFAAGMVLLALEAMAIGFGQGALLLEEILSWQQTGLFITSFLPGVWLLFALTYARGNYREVLSRWRWVIVALFAIPLVLSIFFRKSFLIGEPIFDSSLVWLIRLGTPGYVFHLCFLVGAVLILMNLERTLRASVGHMRWQIKYMVLGVGAIFGVRIYTASQTVLFHSLNTGLLLLNAGVLVIADALILRSLLRTRSFKLDFYPSHSFLYSSLTLLIAGIYLLVVGVLSKLIHYLDIGASLYLNAFIVFLALLGLSIILLSDRLRQKLKQFISTHLRRPQYDYRKEWMEFTQATTSVMEIKDLCSAIAKKISKTFETLCVSLWLVDEKEETLSLGGSTVLTAHQAEAILSAKKGGMELIRALREKQVPVDIEKSEEDWAVELRRFHSDFLKEARIRYGVPLSAGGHLMGLLTLEERVAWVPLTMADFDLLKTIGDQTAGILLNYRLSEHLRRLKENEAYQTMSAFMMHDLKNLASNLSLTMQNLPVHFNNPDFREDALKMIQQSVSKLNNMCSRLSMLSQRIDLKQTEADLNEVVKASLPCLNGSSHISLVQDLRPLPKVLIDPEQVQKVITNLLLNASEAIKNQGIIRVTTEHREGWAILAISDNGCGMSKEFVERSLFRPFKTTKKQGMGIGLYQSKMIVEAHQGRIEVETEEGKGSTFKVFLPLARK